MLNFNLYYDYFLRYELYNIFLKFIIIHNLGIYPLIENFNGKGCTKIKLICDLGKLINISFLNKK